MINSPSLLVQNLSSVSFLGYVTDCDTYSFLSVLNIRKQILDLLITSLVSLSILTTFNFAVILALEIV